MFKSKIINTIRVTTPEAQKDALTVIKSTYRNEKKWVNDENIIFPAADLDDNNLAWFLVYRRNVPAGVLRVCYNPPLHLYKEYGLKISVNGLDVEKFITENKIAEIGRFAVLPRYRKRISIASELMRAGTKDTVERGYTHYVTDVFEGEKHSPLRFHTRMLGFKTVATHEIGELNCSNRRITMILDLKEAYNRLKHNRNRLYRFLTAGWPKHLHAQLTA